MERGLYQDGFMEVGRYDDTTTEVQARVVVTPDNITIEGPFGQKVIDSENGIATEADVNDIKTKIGGIRPYNEIYEAQLLAPAEDQVEGRVINEDNQFITVVYGDRIEFIEHLLDPSGEIYTPLNIVGRTTIFKDGKIKKERNDSAYGGGSTNVTVDPFSVDSADITLSSGWSNYGGTWGNAQVVRQGKIGFLQNSMKVTTAGVQTPQNAIVATLPAGFRPKFAQTLVLLTVAGPKRFDFMPDGTLVYKDPAAALGWIALGQSTFQIA